MIGRGPVPGHEYIIEERAKSTGAPPPEVGSALLKGLLHDS